MNNYKQIMVELLTPKESNVCSQWTFLPPYDSFGVERGYEHIHVYKHTIHSGLDNLLTPLESYVYSILGFHRPYDSFGVERGCEHIHVYKHTIPSGLAFQKRIAC